MPRPYRHPIFLTALPALLLFCGAQLYTQRLDRRANTAFNTPIIRQFLADDQAVRFISTILSNYRLSHGGQDIPYPELQTLLLKTGTIEHFFYYTDSTTGGRVHLSVLNNRCFLVGNYDHTFPTRPPYRPYEIITAFRRVLYIVGYATWALLLAAYLSTPSPRRCPDTLHVLLLVALASTLLASTTYPPPSFTRLFDEDVPLWGLLMTTATLPLFFLRRPRPDYPACPTCSYNLTGNVSGLCPECGTPIPSTPH